LPRQVAYGQAHYEYIQTLKHDFFAATGLYRGPNGLAVLKLGRVTDFMSLPMRWLGRYLSRREARMYQAAQGLAGIPRLIGMVGESGFLHEYVPGRPLHRRESVPDAFFEQLAALLAALHGRHMAYVDLNKRENILRGDDGRPYLIDFQISLHLPPTGWRRLPPARWLLALLQRADRYHCLKHKRRLRPDLLTPAERAGAQHIDFWIRLHRFLTRPLTYLRRRTVRRLRRTGRIAVPGASAK